MAETFTKVVAPTLGLVLSNAMFAAPLAQVDAARKAGALGALNPLPFVAIFSNCVLCVPSLTPGCQAPSLSLTLCRRAKVARLRLLQARRLHLLQ